MSHFAAAQQSPDSSGPETTNDIFNLHLDLPDDSRVDYLRIYYYDTSAVDSRAWLTSYNDAGGYIDRTTLTSAGSTGYGTALSGFVDHVVDNINESYTLLWRGNVYGSDMRLCGLRIAYRLSDGAGGYSTSLSYLHVAGSTLRPRDSETGWFPDESGGCLSVAYPPLFEDGFESGNTLAWTLTVP